MPQANGALPLDDVTVLAVEQYGAGPFGTMLLGDLGADVLKIENPTEGGDVSRRVGPYFLGDDDSLFYQAFNRNKRSMTLNLKHPKGRDIFHALVRKADAVYDNLRGDQPAKLGLTYDTLGHVNRKIVCAHLTGYGRDNERATWPGYDYLMQAEAGYLSLTGEPNGPPTRMGLSIVDMMTGVMTVYGLVCGVVGARATGRGMDVDVSLFGTALHNLSYLAAWYLNAGHAQAREPRSAHPSLVPSQLYRTKDGWLFIMCNKEKFWPILAEKMGRGELGDDPRFATFAARLENRDALTEIVDAALSRRSTAEWTERLGGHVPIAPVYDVAQALDNPFARDGGRIADFHFPDGERDPVRMLAGPVRVGGRQTPTRAGPPMGADTDSVLTSLGLDADTIAALKTEKVV